LWFIPEIERQRKKDLEFKDIMGYTVRPCLKRQKRTNELNDDFKEMVSNKAD
jgi:hypothetical protein